MCDLVGVGGGRSTERPYIVDSLCSLRSEFDRAIAAVEEMFLPPVKFTKSEQHTRIFLSLLNKLPFQDQVFACCPENIKHRRKKYYEKKRLYRTDDYFKRYSA